MTPVITAMSRVTKHVRFCLTYAGRSTAWRFRKSYEGRTLRENLAE
jgi:hypothetical protein